MSYYRGGRSDWRNGNAHDARVMRAFEQPLALMRCTHYAVSRRWSLQISSSSGAGYYEVCFDSKSGSCTCPDFERRRAPCKHMLCVLLRVLKLKNNDFHTLKAVGQNYENITAALLRLFQSRTEQDKKTSDAVKDDESSAVVKDEEKEQPAQKQQQQQVEEEETCLICLLEFTPSETDSTRCGSHCRRWLGHAVCLRTWFARSPCCPLCKGPQRCARDDARPAKRARRVFADEDDDGELDVNRLQELDDDEQLVQGIFEVLQE